MNHLDTSNHKSDNGSPASAFTLGDFCIDEYKPIKVIVIGAGISGLLAGIRFPQKIPNVELTTYEKSAGVGGTWYNNNYPGLACDNAAHSYQYSFEEKSDWTSFYASGPEIRQNLETLVDKYRLMRYIKLQHEVVHARYDVATGHWHLRIRRPNLDTGEPEEIEDSAQVLIMAIGMLSRWKWPDIEGLHDFKGELRHSAAFEPHPKTWQEVAEPWANKNVGVIGVGSSAIQIVSALQPKVGHLTNYSRGKTWLAPPFVRQIMVKMLERDGARGGLDDLHFSSEEKERLKNDPEFAREFRCAIEAEHNQKLAKKPWIAENLIPDFPVSCRRLTPGPGYLEALCSDNVDLVSAPIKRITEKGVETVDGKHQEMDVIICATGYDTSYQLPFQIIGKDGTDINAKWKPHPTSYLSVAVDGFPNMFMSLGPNSVISTGTLVPLIEYQIGYAVQATAKLQRERLKSIEVKAEAVRDFDEYLEAYFPKTVFADNCRSWYKVGKEEGRVVGLWPGSTLHGLRALMHPRWEDFNYERADPVKNGMYWLGDGQTYNEKTLTGDRAWYLRPPFLDVPPAVTFISFRTSSGLIQEAPGKNRTAIRTSRDALCKQGVIFACRPHFIGWKLRMSRACTFKREFCIDECEPIKVIVIGAGFSGLLAGIRFPQKIPNVQLTIYEKNARVGGTWYSNNYPGVACDNASHSYQFSFEEKSDWTSFYACGSEIHQHLEEIAEKYKLMRYIKLQHEVIHAQYDAPTGRWHVRIRRPNAKTGMLEDVEDSAQVLIGAFGVLSRWKWPDIEGLHDFKGELLHSAGFKPYPKTWQEIAEPWTDKKVGVIGAGSSAIQIVAALQPKVGHISIGRDSAADGPEDMLFTQEEIERLKNDPKLARDFRSTVESDFNSVHACTIRGTPQSLQFTEILQESMKRKLMKKPWIAEHLIPSYSAICRRLTPGPGYLEALCADNADFVHSPIKKITDRGIETVSGDFQELDVIICATGYDTSYQLPFPIIGKDGVDINEKWSPHPTSYLSIAVDGFPNMFMSLGPNSAVATGTLIPLIEYQIGYAVQATAKLQRERLKSIEVKAEAVQDFDDYIEVMHHNTPLCLPRNAAPGTKSGKTTAEWLAYGPARMVTLNALLPSNLLLGSMLHGMKALIYPRWEDYNYERADPIQNRLYWLGDGQTYNEKTLSGDRAWYLHPPYLDVPPVPEA
ncbi:hypothetical protein ONZ51_g6367 [Trametes cubensis]|uniref:Uncharacterized protein n=1 Tax=Trametes cubensis TaxID=1111947 RepID=A0AAD7TUD9_9APHY|nr:hypothetical protein ONZ51_g6367 [Trametes cubensis]